MAQALRDPFTLVSRCLSSPPRQPKARILPANNSTKRQDTTAASSSGPSKLVAALDAYYLNSAIDVIEPATDIRHEFDRGSCVEDLDRNVRKGKKQPSKQFNTVNEAILQP